jgi:hypothetical protein
LRWVVGSQAVFLKILTKKVKNHLHYIGCLIMGLQLLPAPAAWAEKPNAPVKFDYPDQRSPGSITTPAEYKVKNSTPKRSHWESEPFISQRSALGNNQQ